MGLTTCSANQVIIDRNE